MVGMIIEVKEKELNTTDILDKLYTLDKELDRNLEVVKEEQNNIKAVIEANKAVAWEKMCDDLFSLRKYAPIGKEFFVDTGIKACSRNSGRYPSLGFVIRSNEILFHTIEENTRGTYYFCFTKDKPFRGADTDHMSKYDMDKLTNVILANWEECFENIKRNLVVDLEQRMKDKIAESTATAEILNTEFEKWVL